MSTIDAGDLAMLGAGFDAAMRDGADAASITSALFELGWPDALATAPAQTTAVAFAALGTTGATVGIIDDVMVHALGLEPDPGLAVVLPAPAGRAAPGRQTGDRSGIVVDGMASSRLDHATTVIVALDSGAVVRAPAPAPPAADHGRAFRRLRIDLDAAATTPVEAPARWEAALAAGRVALAHELVAAARTMLEQARQHAVDRVQFGRPIASFQAIRHRLAEALAAIEGAAAVANAAGADVDPLLAALAKSLAGQAARTTGTHAQQVLAGIGFTTDHPFQRWLKRALLLDVVLGSSASLPAEIGAELLRRGAAPRLVEL